MTVLLDGYTDTAGLAREFHCTERTIQRWVNQPDGIPHVKVGSKLLFRIDHVRLWLESRERQRNPRSSRRKAA